MVDDDGWRWQPPNHSTERVNSSNIVKSREVEIPFYQRVPENDNNFPYYNVAMSKIWRDLPLDLVKDVIDFMAADILWNEWNDNEYDPIIRKNGLFADWSHGKPWNHLLAIGSIFRTEAFRRMIRWDLWRFEDCHIFARALNSWQNISPGSWKQIRMLELGEVRFDGSNHSDIMSLLSRVVMFDHLKLLRISFELDIGLRGYICRYFDDDGDLDETYPQLFDKILTCRAPRAQITGLDNWIMTQYLESVISGETPVEVRGPGMVPPWRRVLPSTDDIEALGWWG